MSLTYQEIYNLIVKGDIEELSQHLKDTDFDRSTSTVLLSMFKPGLYEIPNNMLDYLVSSEISILALIIVQRLILGGNVEVLVRCFRIVRSRKLFMHTVYLTYTSNWSDELLISRILSTILFLLNVIKEDITLYDIVVRDPSINNYVYDDIQLYALFRVINDDKCMNSDEKSLLDLYLLSISNKTPSPLKQMLFQHLLMRMNVGEIENATTDLEYFFKPNDYISLFSEDV